MKRSVIGLIVVALLATGSLPAYGVLLVRESEYLSASYGYGGSDWSTISANLDAATAFSVTEVANFDDAGLVASADALWIDLGELGAGASLSAAETTNITNFIASGKRVVMIGENNGWADWNNLILGLVGGAFSGTNHSGNITAVVANELTDSADTVNVPYGGVAGGTAVGGTALYSKNVITLWDDNVLTVLDVNMFSDTYIGVSDNAEFAQNTVDWVAASGKGVIPEPSTVIIWSLLGALGITFGWYRKRKVA